jgi:hypothetical protein
LIAWTVLLAGAAAGVDVVAVSLNLEINDALRIIPDPRSVRRSGWRFRIPDHQRYRCCGFCGRYDHFHCYRWIDSYEYPTCSRQDRTK